MYARSCLNRPALPRYAICSSMRRGSGTSSRSQILAMAPVRPWGSPVQADPVSVRFQSFKSAGTFPPFAANLFIT
jgi:hypothetical protein